MKRSRQSTLWQFVVTVGEHARGRAGNANQTGQVTASHPSGHWRGDQPPNANTRAEPERVEVVDGRLIVVMPCHCRPVILRREELHPTAVRG